MITRGDVLKALAKKRMRKKFMHKTKYGIIGEEYCYDKRAHQEHFDRIKHTPYSPLWDK